jgi:hypothetical protein
MTQHASFFCTTHQETATWNMQTSTATISDHGFRQSVKHAGAHMVFLVSKTDCEHVYN